MREYLKIKIKSLAAEARIIRHEERKVKAWKREPGDAPDDLFFGLQSHRKGEVRGESRSALLAYGYLRGTPYRTIEATCFMDPNWKRVESLIIKYGGLGHNEAKVAPDKIAEWRDTAI